MVRKATVLISRYVSLSLALLLIIQLMLLRYSKECCGSEAFYCITLDPYMQDNDSLVEHLLQLSEEKYKKNKKQSDSLVLESFNLINSDNSINRLVRAEALHIIGKHLVDKGQYLSGVDSLMKSLNIKLMDSPGSISPIMKTYVYLGIGHFRLRDFDSSFYYYNKVINTLTKAERWDINLFNAYMNKGINYADLGIFDTASLYFDTARIVIDSADFTNISEQLAGYYYNYALLKTISGKLKEADDLYKICSEQYDSIEGDNLESLAGIYNNRGLNNYQRFELAKAELLFKKSLELYAEKGVTKPEVISHIYINLNLIAQKKSDYYAAIDYCLLGLSAKPDNDFKVTLYKNLAVSNSKLNKLDQAREYYKAALSLLDKDNVNPKRKQEILSEYAEYLMNTEKDKSSLKYIKLALNESSKLNGVKSEQYGLHLITLGDYYLNIDKNPDSAIYYYYKARNILNEYNNENDSDNLNILGEKRLEIGLAGAYELKYSASKISSDLIIADSIYNDVLKKLETVSKQLSDDNKLILLEIINPVYAKAVNCSYTLYKLTSDEVYKNNVFRYVEQSKSAALLAEINSENALKTSDIPTDIFNEENKLKDEINNFRLLIDKENIEESPSEKKIKFFESRLLSSIVKYDSLVTCIETNYPKYYSAKYQNNTIDIGDIMKSLPSNQVLIEYMLTDSLLYTIFISDSEFLISSQYIDKEFFDALNNLISVKKIRLHEQNIARFYAFKSDSYFLWKKLIEPFSSLIEDKKLIIIPDGLLGYLSFDLLIEYDFETERISYGELPYLIRKHPISYANNATLRFSDYFTKRRDSKELHNIVAFAPSYNDSYTDTGVKLEPLHTSQSEVKNIVSKYGGRALTGNNATKDRFNEMIKESNILHLAMHTIFNDSLPLQSKLVFYNDKNDSASNYLYTHEIYNKDIKASMVTLSACNTASGEFKKGEGIISLSRGFVYAGVPSIVMTLWEVQDETGSKIMDKYYENIFLGMDKDVALQKAKVSVLGTLNMAKSHPFFWSAYVINGDTLPIVPTSSKPDYYKFLILASFAIVSLLIYRHLKRKKRKANPDS